MRKCDFNNIEKKINKSKNRGISLIVLIITIIVAIILAGTAIVNIGNGISQSGKVAFANDLLKVEEGVKAYYLQNQSFPAIDGTSAMSQDDILNLSNLSDDEKSSLLLDLESNLDKNLDGSKGEFYQIDLAKIDVTKSVFGTRKDGANDVFVVSASSMKAYYLKGVTYDEITYFSLNEQLSLATNVTKADIVYNTQTIAGITVKKAVNTWSNKMGINIEASIAGTEKLYMSLATGIEKEITTEIGLNTFSFDTLQEIVAGQANITVAALTEADATAFDALAQANKYIEIIKKSEGIEIGRIRVDLTNYESVPPVYAGDAVVTPGQEKNVVEFTVSDDISKVGEVRYEYLTEFDVDANIVNSYNITDFDATYLINKGKKATIINDKVQITLPKNIKSIQVLVLDNAKNWIKFSINNTVPSVYVGVTPQILSLTRAKFKVALNSSNGISTVKTYLSINGAAYSNEKIYTLNTNNVISSIICDDYTSIVGASDSVNIKIVATDNKTIDNLFDTTIIKFKSGDEVIYGAKIGSFTTDNITINGEASSYNNPVIPVGFKAVNTSAASWGDDVSIPTDWNSGLVIEDKNGNQFVWVPVDGTNVKYEKNFTFASTYSATADNTTDDTTPAGFNVSNITDVYKGFYIARYESMFEYVGGQIRAASKKNINKLTTDWSTTRNNIYNGYLWNYINYTDAKTYSESMATNYSYDLTKIGTNLITGTEWDTTMKWIQNSGSNVMDSRAWGNYTDSISPANLAGYGSLQASGYGEYWKSKNIYDLAGNAWEITSEKHNTQFVGRGGSYNYNGQTYSASYRYATDTSTLNDYQTFRVALYIK